MNQKQTTDGETRCGNCAESKGFYRLKGAAWCMGCGHRREARKELSYAPTTAYEIARAGVIAKRGAA